MSVNARIFSVIVPLVLVACASNGADTDKAPPATPPVATATTAPDAPSGTTATLVVGHIDTGFLFFGGTRIAIVSVDGRRTVSDQNGRVTLAPGAHTIFVRAFRDPVAAYGCVTYTFEAGKTYVVQTTKPYMEKTTMWLDDQATGAIASQKVDARMVRDPAMWGPALKALFLDSPPTGC